LFGEYRVYRLKLNTNIGTYINKGDIQSMDLITSSSLATELSISHRKMKEILLDISLPCKGVGLEFVDGGKGKKQRVVVFSKAGFEAGMENQSKTLHREKKKVKKEKKT
jgi:hypothetical protein